MTKVNVISEIDWEPKPLLRPGMDFIDGVAYYTVTLLRNKQKPGKGKDADPIMYKEPDSYVITSEGAGFWYDEESLDEEGFTRSEQMFVERVSPWGLKSVRAYLDQETEAPETSKVFKDLRDIYTTYVEYSNEIYYDMMALFIMYTYVFRLFESTGYIHFNGTAASGKSRNLSIIKALAFNPVWASNMSPASLYRRMAGSPGTTCIDESEGFDGERGEELRRILNAGYREGSKVIRTEKVGKEEKFMPIEFDVFGPKALASIKVLEDVIQSRCVVIGMRPTLRILPDFDMNDEKWAPVRDSLYLWAINNASEIAGLGKEWSDEKHERLAPLIRSRNWEITSQFVILADYVGGEEFATKIITFLNDYFAKSQKALNETDRLRTTLRCLPRVMATKASRQKNQYSLKDIHEVITGYLEDDTAEYFKTKHAGANLNAIGFKDRVRAAGGLWAVLDEDTVRAEFIQRRVDPFEEDTEWLAGNTSYQNHPHKTPPPIPKGDDPIWDLPEENDD